MAAKYELDLRDYIRILKKRRYTIIFSAIMMGVFSYIFARLQEPIPIYQASATVKIEKSTTMPGLYMESMAIGEGDNLETQAKIIKSYPIVEKVAKSIGKLDPNLTPQEIRQNNDLLNLVLGLKDQVETERDGYTNLVNIMVTSNDPKFAQKLANTVAEVYKDENTREKNKRADEAVKFIGNQLTVVKGKLTAAEEKLKQYREENKLISLDAQSTSTLSRLTAVEADWESKKALLKEIQAMIKTLESDTALSTETLEGGIFADGTTQLFKVLNNQLTNLRVSLDTLLLVYTDKHPEVLELRESMKKTKENMLKELYAHRTTMEERTKKAGELFTRLQNEFQALPQSGLTLVRLERDVKLQGEVYTLLEEKYQEALIRQAERVEEVVIVRPALEPSYPINPPNTASTAFIGVILGMTLGLVFSFISETLDTSIGTIEDVEEFIGVSVIGIIPYVSEEEIKEILLKKADTNQDEEILMRNARLVSHFAPHSTLAESYRTLRTNIQFASLEKNGKVLLLTSSSAQEGKSTTTANLAMTMAQIGYRTLLIDADLRKPMVNKVFGLEREPGLSDILLGNYELEEAIKTVTDIMMGKMGMEDIMRTPGIDNLNIVTSGVIPPNPSELLNSPAMKAFIDRVREMYDVVIFDTTPILPATDAAILGSKVDAVILVYKAGQIARGALKRAKVQMDNVNANVLGVVLNALKSEVSSDFQDYRYDTYYSYGAEHQEEPKTLAEKLEYYSQIARENFEKYTGDFRTRLAILGVSLFLMLGGIILGEVRLSAPPKPPTIAQGEKEGVPPSEERTVGMAGISGPDVVPPSGEGKPGGPSAPADQGPSPEKGTPPEAGPSPGPLPTEEASLWSIQSLQVGLVIVVFLVALFFAIRWYLTQKEDEEEDYEDEEEEGEEDKKEGEGKTSGEKEEKESFAGIKHVDLSLDLPHVAPAPESAAPSEPPAFKFSLPGMLPEEGTFSLPEIPPAGQDQKTLSAFSVPGAEAPAFELPDFSIPGPASQEGKDFPDFKFVIPGMEEAPSLDLPGEVPASTDAETGISPSTPGQPPGDHGLEKHTEETLIDSTFKGFAEPDRFGELDGEELPDFSDFGKMDFSGEDEKEQRSPLEEIKATPHPEGGALESFPEERDAPPAPSSQLESAPPAAAIPSEEEKAPVETRAITWDTSPLPEVEIPVEGLSAFAEEPGSPTPKEEFKKEETPPSGAEEVSWDSFSLTEDRGAGGVAGPSWDSQALPEESPPAPLEEVILEAFPLIEEESLPSEDVEPEILLEETPEVPLEGELVLEAEPLIEEPIMEEPPLLEGLEAEIIPEETADVSLEGELVLEAEPLIEESIIEEPSSTTGPGELVEESLSSEGKGLVEEVEFASMEEDLAPEMAKWEELEKEEATEETPPVFDVLSSAEKKEAPDRSQIEKRIFEQMLTEGEDVNQLLETWKIRQKEELEAHFQKKRSLKKLKSQVHVLERKIETAKSLQPEKTFRRMERLGEKILTQSEKVSGLYKKYEEYKKKLSESVQRSPLPPADGRDDHLAEE